MATMLSRTARSFVSRTYRRPVLVINNNATCKYLGARWMSSYPDHEVIGMPSLSPTMESGSIAKWNVSEGEEFAAGDSLCEVETDKATVDFEAQDEGVVARILAASGPGEIQCGEPILIVVEDTDDVDAFKDYTLDPSSSGTAVKEEPASSATTPTPPTPAPPAPAPAAVTPPPTPTPTPTPNSGEKVVASPLAHMLAKELGFDISQITGTGPNGRIIAADVKEFTPALATTSPLSESSTSPTTETPLSPIPGEGFTDYPLTASAKEIAARLAASKSNVPHYYLTVDLELDSLLALRKRLNAALSDDEAGITLNDLLIKAAACSMKAVPSVNASWMESVVRVYENVDINVAIGSGDGLITPLISNANKKGVKSISDDLSSFVTAVESEEGISAENCGMGTFTVLNLGMYGISSCAPIITEPQAAALALGAAENRIVPNDDDESEEIYREAVMLTATLSCDHRVVDGAVGAQWLSAFKNHVENPDTLLL